MPAEAPKTPRNGPERKTLSPTVISKFGGAGEAIVWDKEVPRLAVRFRPPGAKAFLFVSTLAAKQIKVSLGDARGADHDRIEQARAEARRLQALIDAGTDPRETLKAEAAERDARREAGKPALEIWETYCTARATSKNKPWGARTVRDHAIAVKPGGLRITRGKKTNDDGVTRPGVLRGLLSRPLEEIDEAAIAEWLARESAERPTQAALAFRMLRAFLRWCASDERYTAAAHGDAYRGKDVRENLPRKKSKGDGLQREMLPLWFEHVRRIKNPILSAYLQALLLTGARREELAGLRWENVDFQWKTIVISDKVKGERSIGLTPYVAQLLAPLPRRNEFVFSAPAAKSGRIAEPRIAHNRALTAAGLPPMTLHGLRRSFGTLCEWVECPAGISAQIMGHAPSALAEKHYRRRPLDLLRMWHTKIEAWMLEQAGIAQPAENEKPAGLRAVI